MCSRRRFRSCNYITVLYVWWIILFEDFLRNTFSFDIYIYKALCTNYYPIMQVFTAVFIFNSQRLQISNQMLLQTRLLLFVLHRLHLCIFVILCIQNTNRVSSVIVRWIRICIVCRNFGCIGFRKNAQIFLISYARCI